MINTIVGWLFLILAFVILVIGNTNEINHLIMFYSNLILANMYFLAPKDA